MLLDLHGKILCHRHDTDEETEADVWYGRTTEADTILCQYFA